jgi:hypothetical protein
MRLFVIALLLFASVPVALALESGALIPVGTEGGRGPLATSAVITHPLGAVRLPDWNHTSLFIKSGRHGHHPGVFLYPGEGYTVDGTPVFGNGVRVAGPFNDDNPEASTVYQTDDGAIHGAWLIGGVLVHTVYSHADRAFTETERTALDDLPRGPSTVTLLSRPDGGFDALFAVSDGTPFRAPGPKSSRDSSYNPYDGRGIWRGGLPYVALYAASIPADDRSAIKNVRRASVTERDVLLSMQQVTPVDFGDARGLVAGSRFGGLHFYRQTSDDPTALASRVHAVDVEGIAHRHPIINPSPMAFPNPGTGYTDLVAGGEGALYYYRFTGGSTASGKPIFDAPTPVLESDTTLYAGTLAVPNAVDWDADGDTDLVSGNSEGLVLFIENVGGNDAPAFAPGVPIEAAGWPIHVQPGYRLDIQGPGEARWGYTCPTVVDWNRDGLLDLVMSDSTARHHVYLNRGTPTAPKLDAAHSLYMDGLDMHGTWRTKPAAGLLGDRMAYVALDDDDQFHLYWQVDAYNLSDGGKLRLDTGEAIGANFLSSGGSGRLKLNLHDWDDDGLPDLVVGTPRHGSVPDPGTGLPQSLGLPGSAVLFLKNVGTQDAPVFRYPELFTFKGEPIFLGQHACGPTLADFGNANGPDLIVGDENGRFHYYARGDLGTAPAERP